MILSLIAAIGKKNELGINNQLLWNLPSDLKHFRDITSGHPVIMGRKTFESIGRPLPNRKNIVITRDASYSAPGIFVAHSLDEALQLVAREQGSKFEEVDEEVEAFVIGGGQLYLEALPRANRLYLTHVDAELSADTYFPEVNCDEWEEISSESHDADADHAYNYRFAIYKRI
jgi:dihydrofolate reductase